MGIVEAVVRAMPEDVAQSINDLHQKELELHALREQLEGTAELATSAEGELAAKLMQEVRALQEQIEGAQAALDVQAEQTLSGAAPHLDGMRQAARAAMEAVGEGLQDLNDLARAFASQAGLGAGAGGTSDLTIQQKMALAEQVRATPKLRQIAELCGRLQRIARQKQQDKIEREPDQVLDIETGRDVGRLLPTELVLLADPDLEDLFFARHTEGTLLQYQVEGHEPKGKGPIVCAVDSSTSMAQTIAGATKEAWSKAVMLALLMIAREQKRDLAVIFFAGSQQVKTFVFKAGQATLDVTLEAAQYFEQGGTLFEPWMREALRLVTESDFDEADVICLSDGVANITSEMIEEWNQIRQARQMSCFGVLIGTLQGMALMGGITDETVTLAALSSDEEKRALNTIFSI